MPPIAPVPFRQFVLKVHSRCDLACDHCYMYEHADQSWRSRPKVMTLATAEQIGRRAAEHARRHGVETVKFVLHGGEPLLAGVERLEGIILRLRKILDGITTDFRIHTNAVQLDEEFLDLFVRHEVLVGVSLDGDRAANDRHRRYADGRTSHPQVQAALERLRHPKYRHLYSGILCTIDVANDPFAVYEALRAEQPPRVGLLLPHATWDVPPPRPLDPRTGTPAGTSYADWLIAIYERWIADGRPMGIRVFDSISATLRGDAPLSEALGGAPSDVLVIETDGEIEQLDSLKVAFPGAPQTGLTVDDDDLDLALAHPGMQARQTGTAGLAQQCRSCEVVSSCGGGLYPHRYRAGSGFDNPSVYCDDLKKLIVHITASGQARAVDTDALPHHSFNDTALAELASGFGTAATITELVDLQASIARTLLAAVADRLAMRASPARIAWNALQELDRTQPKALAATLAHPYFRSWAVRVVGGDVRDHDPHYLSELAMTTAVQAGVEQEFTLHAVDGAVHLPTLGTLRTTGSEAFLRLTPTALGHLAISAPDRWQPIRTLRSGGFAVRLDDVDPERVCQGRPVADRLPTVEFDRWQDSFHTAWQLILKDYPAYSPGLTAGLSTITPLVSAASGHEISATARQAPAAVAAALPDAPELLALLLL
ncbi:MAG: FxsB family cyclophane-forming radical SAM/SPASM peptide maturase, partial [Catenulispora sp.]